MAGREANDHRGEDQTMGKVLIDDRIERADRSQETNSMADIIENTKYDMLYVGVIEELIRCRTCLEHGHRASAIRHLEEAWSLCNDYNAQLDLWQACQDQRNKMANSPQLDEPRTPKRQRATSLPSEPGSARSTHLSNSGGASSTGSLFNQLLSELKEESPSSKKHMHNKSKHQQPQARGAAQDGELGDNSYNLARFSALGFEGIDKLLERLRQEEDVRKPIPEQKALGAANTPTVEKVLEWQMHNLPQSPSTFKDSEDPSPRRHSFPVASPWMSPSSSSSQPRKRSIQVMHQATTSPDNAAVSPIAPIMKYSESKYSRRLSHNETSTALLDTPALTKLIDQIHTNPFVNSSHSMTGKIRRLSADGLPIQPLGVTTAMHDRVEPTVPSPLRESFAADQLPNIAKADPPRATTAPWIPSSALNRSLSTGGDKRVRSSDLYRTFSSRLPRPERNGHRLQKVDESAAQIADGGLESRLRALAKRSTDPAPAVQDDTLFSTDVPSRNVHELMRSGHKVNSGNTSASSESGLSSTSRITAIRTALVESSPPPPAHRTAKSPSSQYQPWTSDAGGSASSKKSTPSSTSLSSSPFSDSSSKRALKPEPLALKPRPHVFSPEEPFSMETLPSALETTARVESLDESHISSPSTVVGAEAAKQPPSTSPPRTPHHRILQSTPTASPSSITPSSHRSDSPSPSVSSLASRFETPNAGHRVPNRSSSNTQHAFRQGLARAQASFTSSHTHGTTDSKKVKAQEAQFETRSSVTSGRSSPSDSHSQDSNDKPSQTTTRGLQRSGSVSHRVLAIHERPPWQRPGKISTTPAIRSNSVPWTSRKRTNTFEPTSGTSTHASRGLRSWTHSTTESSDLPTRFRSGSTLGNGGFVRFGNEMARGAGMSRD